MIRILFFWLLEFFLFLGVGILFQRAFVRGRSLGVMGTLWMGIITLMAFLQILHLFFPINGVVLILFVLTGVLGWIFSKPWRQEVLPGLRTTIQTVERRRLGVFVLIFTAVCLLAAIRCSWETLRIEGDTALYHWNLVRWANDYPAVPGLANLHNRFGFNSSYLLWSAMIDNFWGDRRSAMLMPGFLVVVLALQWFACLLLETRRSLLTVRLYSLLTLPYFIWLMWFLTPSLYHDNAQAIALLVMVHSMISWHGLQGEKEATPQPETQTWCMYWMCLGALSFTFKLSGAVLPPLCLALSAWLLLRGDAGWRSRQSWLRLAAACVLPGLLIAGYVARNIVQSGWPLYPVPVLNLHLSWAVPYAELKDLYEIWIRDWARLPGAEGLATVKKGFWYWFPKWHQSFRRGTYHECLWIGTFAILFLMMRPRRQRETAASLPWFSWFVIGLFALNLLTWFNGAPDTRFGAALFWGWMAVTVAFAITAWIRSVKIAWIVALVVACHLQLHSESDVIPLSPFSLSKVERAPVADLELVTVPNGQTPPLQIYLTKDRKDSAPGDSPLPSSIVLNPNLMWREPGNLGAGFWQRTPAEQPAGKAP